MLWTVVPDGVPVYLATNECFEVVIAFTPTVAGAYYEDIVWFDAMDTLGVTTIKGTGVEQEPDDSIFDLEETVQELVANNQLDASGAQSLYNQLNQALSFYNDGKPNKAVNKLQVFIGLVQEFIPGKIIESDGQILINIAQGIIDQIENQA